MQSNGSGKNFSAKGLTLVEVMVVVAIIGVLAAIAVPNYISSLPTYRLRSAARDLMGAMQGARLNAVKESRDWGVDFDPANNRYRKCYENSAGTGNWSTMANITCEGYISLTGYQSGVQFGSGGAGVADNVTFGDDVAYFNARGFLVGTSGYCYIENEKEDSFRIGAFTSGVVKMEKWTGSGWSM